MPVTRLHITDVGPFDELTVDFDPRVNVFTGPNNSGKSSLLWVLGELLVYPFTMPTKILRSDQPLWSLNISAPEAVDPIEGTLPSNPQHMVSTYERIGYTCYVPAQRLSTNFRSSGPTVSQGLESQLDQLVELFAEERSDDIREVGIETFRQAMRNDLFHQSHPELAKRSKLMMAGNALVSDKVVKQKFIDLDYASTRREKPAIREALNQVSLVVSEITKGSKVTEGFPIQFIGVAEDSRGLYPAFRTPDGDLPLDVLSQGTQSMIQLLSHILLRYAEYYDFPSDLKEKPGIVILDEIDAHLHPAWQRRIIPALTKYLPNLQIICSTHSPLMLAGLHEGQVQLLRRGDDGKVTVSRNESDIAGWTADEILRQFLEVFNPTDMATADRVSRYDELSRKETLTDTQAEELEQLRQTVRSDLLSGPMSAQVMDFAKELERARGELCQPAQRVKGDEGGFAN